MPPKRTPLRQNNDNNVNFIKKNPNALSQSTEKKIAGVNSHLTRRENVNVANVVGSLSTEKEESTLESFVDINDDIESRGDMFFKRKELSEDLDFEITKKPKTVPGFFYKYSLTLHLSIIILL